MILSKNSAQNHRSIGLGFLNPTLGQGCDIILYAVRKQRGEITKLVRVGVLPWCNEGKRRGKKSSFSSVHRVTQTYKQIS